mmetsp:Transcript_3407/g.3366  ORF Transcript_3407/g.3366 Transcript_3407/m.3366 type:complete len:123 (+) Transcript_3407:897-1265(+)|eukprot:CAMPEP_0170540654 /NCGR_PEP_ID=MMETSP0211-20121228/626_1 /TAXON_ID=311385 /ORGANISM="Pseudokeronopsis sp., Strain OXSARD2" /LENGTH=122 /DNA_ID=CAMNT_0010843147 /DNA_START=877 /DNA_END=1245 /DNA_ORIENTATION=+
MKKAVAKQPIGVGMNANFILQFYGHGVVTEKFLWCSNPKVEVNHGITIIGYGKVNDKDLVMLGHCSEYWIIKNSWGKDWGEKGLFRLCMDGAGDWMTPMGTCHVNKYATWPTMEEGEILMYD